MLDNIGIILGSHFLTPIAIPVSTCLLVSYVTAFSLKVSHDLEEKCSGSV